jgi:tetratricopeptide (TPR) repeat protein
MKLAAGRIMECLAVAPLGSPTGQAGAPSVGAAPAADTWNTTRLAYKRGDCVGVLNENNALLMSSPDAMVPTDVEVMQALCLSRTGRRQEAIKAMDSLLLGQVQLLDAQYLHYLLGNWLFEEKQAERAAETYRAVLNEAQERDRWAALAKLKLDQIDMRREEWISVPTSRTSEEAGDESPVLVTTKPPQDFEPAVKKPSETIVVSKGQPAETPVETARSAHLREAESYLESGRYVEAIEAYQALLGSEYDSRAQEGIQVAQDRYALGRRREAASLVLNAHAKSDPQERKAFLERALGVLEAVNRKYPNNRYAAKIDQNKRDVIERIQEIDPNFRASSPGFYQQGSVRDRDQSGP